MFILHDRNAMITIVIEFATINVIMLLWPLLTYKTLTNAFRAFWTIYHNWIVWKVSKRVLLGLNYIRETRQWVRGTKVDYFLLL